jgi:hypothetical protein
MLIYSEICLSSTMSDSEEEKLDEAQSEQGEVGEAGSDPETSGPAENLREKAAKATDKTQDSEEPA